MNKQKQKTLYNDVIPSQGCSLEATPSETLKKFTGGRAEACLDHSTNEKFLFIYSLFNLNDKKTGRQVGIARSTISKYRRGCWACSNHMKTLIAQAFTILINHHVDSRFLWGDEEEFVEFKEGLKK